MHEDRPHEHSHEHGERHVHSHQHDHAHEHSHTHAHPHRHDDDTAGLTYSESGVDVAAGNEAVRLLKERLKSTKNPLVLEGIGGFGGIMRMPPIKDAVLVAGADGAGTKTMIAREMGVWHTVGIDAVAMNVNDVSACGAVPFFFLDYLVVAKLIPERVAAIVSGVDEGCLRAECVLLGGETGEHPGHFSHADDFDLAGFAVGLAARHELWGPGKVQAGDVVLGLASNGVHSNGFSLVRKLLAERGIALDDRFPGSESREGGARSIGDELLTPTAVYSPVLHDLGHACDVHAAAHVTGGGFPDNVSRALPKGLAAELDLSAWQPPPVFAWLHGLGVAHDELLRTFNCGLGMVVVMDAEHVAKNLTVIEKAGQTARVVGTVAPRDGGGAVRYRGALGL
jgi:phosphoribosylformylglycinamidine cyclo-ligase